MGDARSGTGRAARWLAVVAAVLVLFIAAVGLALDSDAISGSVKDLVVPRASEALGRELTVADARLRLFPNPRVALGNATLAGRPGEPPLVRIRSLDVEVAFWPLVRSLGDEIRVKGLTVARPEVNLVRGRDGRWNHEGLGGDARAAARGGGPTSQGRSAPLRFRIEKALVADGTLRVVDLSQGRNDQAVALTRMDLTASGGHGAPVLITFSAALAAEEKNLELVVDSPMLPESLAAGEWPDLQGRFELSGLELAQLHGFFPADLAAIARGGRLDVTAELKSEDGGYRLEGKGGIDDLRLQGEPAGGSFRVTATAKPGGPARVEVSDLTVKGPGIELGGSAELETEPVRARFQVAGPLLDLGTLLGLAPTNPGERTDQEPEAPASSALLPPALQQQVSSLAVTGTIDIGKVVSGSFGATDVAARAVLADGVLTLDRAGAKLYGGQVDVSGTKVHLAEEDPRWTLAARLQDVDLGSAMQAITGAAPLVGRLTGTIDLAGAGGADWQQLKKTLTGEGALALADGALTTTDVGDEALAAISKGLALAGRRAAAGKVSGAAGGRTTLDDITADFEVKDGFLTLTRPLTFRSSAGEARLGGRIGLSQELALAGNLALSKELLARAGAGKALRPGVRVPLALGGTLGSPSVAIAADQVIARAARGAARRTISQKRGAVEQRTAEKAKGLLERLGR